MSFEEDHYDALLGGNEVLPHSVTLSKFVAYRSQEIQIMKNSLVSQTGTKLAFQTIPKHMRRRAMSHNVKRLPRRLRQIHLSQMKKSGVPTKQKRPSRKYRRRPRNLMEEYTRRANKKYRWLQTHIWHAKRFHMVEKWGYKLPHSPCDKAFRACYRAMAQHCLLQDISYVNALEVGGNRSLIVEKLKGWCRTDRGLSVGAKAFIDGSHEGELIFYDTEHSFSKVVGSVNFQWQPSCKEMSRLWLWVHPAFYNTIKSILLQCFENMNVVILHLGRELCRFRLTGPLSSAVVQDTLVTVDHSSEDLHKAWENDNVTQEAVKNQHDYWKEINNITSVSEVAPHAILSLIVKDPRLNTPKKRTKSCPNSAPASVKDTPSGISASLLWECKWRGAVNDNKITDTQIASLKSKQLVPGSDVVQNKTFIPIILIQRPGNKRANIGLGSGWDIILPSTWAKPFWVAFVMRGARTGGLRETNSMLFEMGKSQYLYPTTKAGNKEELLINQQNKDLFFKKPPNKRTNYNKFSIASPFSFQWDLLIREWSSDVNELEADKFTVVVDKKTLTALENVLNTKSATILEYPKRALIPVRLVCEKRGAPSQFSIICLPKSETDFINSPTEPNHEDALQTKRKELRRAHKCLLKKLRKRRRAKDKAPLPEEHKQMLMEYSKEMRALWLPEPKSIRKSCSREVIGFVTKGGFSFALGKSAATGYIVSDCFQRLLKTTFRNKVLVRNTNSKQYKVARLSVILE